METTATSTENTENGKGASIFELLIKSGIPNEQSERYAKIFQDHEIDSSILTSTLLNHDLLKEIGIATTGHRLKILSIGAERNRQSKAKEEDYNERPKEKLSIDEALNGESSSSTSATTSNNHMDDGMEIEKNLKGQEGEKEGDEKDDEDSTADKIQRVTGASSLTSMDPNVADVMSRCKYIPLRLNEKERSQLHLIEAALSVSDYTGKVDIISYEKKSKRSFEQLKEICAILSGLLVASDYSAGQKLIANRQFKDNEKFFQEVFEVGRRHKIMNPEKMRSEYGKLIYLLQDSALPEIEELMTFSCHVPVKTVYSLLEERNALDLLRDPVIEIATLCIVDDKSKNRDEIQRNIKRKEKAVEHLASKYETSKLSKSEIRLCLRSIGDNHSFLIGARDPLEQMIKLLTESFNPDRIEGQWSLSISFGRGGARLNHDHARQYNYVLQSLTFWRNVTHDMFKLWILSEEDLLDSSNRYKLTNTGQGLNRVQNCPKVGNAMQKLLYQTKRQLTEWVGSSVVHLGDHNVPNALLFIDKYTQIPRIINPVLKTVEQIDEMYKNAGLKSYIDSFYGGKEKVKKDILCDFFKHAFDGSGADNFFDAGSCIDGRLTSAWNWCEKLPKKDFYPIFRLSGFVGFDGDFQR